MLHVGPAGRRQQQLACGDDLTSSTVCGVARPGPAGCGNVQDSDDDGRD
jgi:hypothetical protein